MKALLTCFKRLRPDHWVWFHASVSLIIWGFLYLFITPPGAVVKLGQGLVVVISLFMIVGSFIAIIGLVTSTSNNFLIANKGLAIETFGLIVAFCGPMTHAVIQLSLVEDSYIYLTRSFGSYTLASFILARIIVVQRSLAKRI